ncbi:MAG TPA: hypothetical protein VG204_15530 [Terriglobia bacterium]|nr:hypothetical protein [Terriglobia bacterium]
MQPELDYSTRGSASPKQLWYLLGTLLFLYLLLFIPFRAPIYLPGDVSLYLLDASRSLAGQVIYRDYFEFVQPGVQSVYFALFKLFGPRPWIPGVVLVLLGFGLTWLTLAISKQVLRGWAAFLPGPLFLTFAFRNGLDGSHHWFSVIAVMAAVRIVIKQRTMMRWAAVGVLCSLALFFTQTRGLAAILGFAVFLLWEQHNIGESRPWLLRREGCLLATFIATTVASNAYFVWKAGLQAFMECTVVFGLRYYSGYDKANTLKVYLYSPPGLHPWYALPWVGIYVFIHALLPLVYVLFFRRYYREKRRSYDEPWDRLMLLSIVGLFLFLGVAPAPSLFRLCTVSPPALILAVWLGTSQTKLDYVLGRLLWAFTLILVVVEPLAVQKHWRAYLDLPWGRTAFENSNVYQRYKWVAEHTRPSEYFFEAVWGDLYVPLALRNPAEVPYVTSSEYTRPEQVANVIESLDKDRVKLVLWSVELDVLFADEPAGDHLWPLRKYLREHYHVVKTFPDADQIWERN